MAGEYVKLTDRNGRSVYAKASEIVVETGGGPMGSFTAQGDLYLPDHVHKFPVYVWEFDTMLPVAEGEIPKQTRERLVEPDPEEELVEEVDKALFNQREVSVAEGYDHPVVAVEPWADSRTVLTTAESKSLDSHDLRIRWVRYNGTFFVERKEVAE